MSDTTEWVAQIPSQTVPERVHTLLFDLAFAGRYLPAGPSAEPIAGDFYDLLHLEADLIAVVLGDVAGHGDQALARMQQLRAATRAYAICEPDPASVISRLDRFCACLDAESIATLWYGTYRPSTGTLTYSSAGHPPPVLTCHGDPARLLEHADAPPLGAGSESTVAEHEQVLPVGAVLVAYSDGLVERRGADLGDQLALLQTIVDRACDPNKQSSAEVIAGQVLDALIPDPTTAEDDVCLLVIRRQPCPG